MDPITLIVSALAAGAAAGGGSVASQAIQDAYNGLKSLIGRKFAGKGSLQAAVTGLESAPESKPWQGMAAAELEAAGAGKDQDVIDQARKLLDLVGPASPSYNATLTGSGAIAQGPGAVAAGAGGIAVGGSVYGGISAGGGSAAGGGGGLSAGSGVTPDEEAATLRTQREMRRRLLMALQNERMLAGGAEAARLDVQIDMEQAEIRRLEARLDALGRG